MKKDLGTRTAVFTSNAIVDKLSQNSTIDNKKYWLRMNKLYKKRKQN
ncbi:hypothetical protein KUH03_03365 [Sphingobacterium sp. E70]|nr:hypothetical protein [Sphingobacterium sp. E70]ULT26024.1 hypothetical protein KUH03_03365 [Sphingobacterium sp. E70]